MAKARIVESYVEPTPPEANVPAVTTTPQLTERVAGLENIMRGILWLGIISVGGVIVAGCGLVIDQLRVNHDAYEQLITDEKTHDDQSAEIKQLQAQITNLRSQVSNTPKQ